MTRYASILRSEEGLNKSRQKLLNLEVRLEDMSLSEEAIPTRYFKVRNMIQAGKLVIYSALLNRLSLGSHYREDFPPNLPALV